MSKFRFFLTNLYTYWIVFKKIFIYVFRIKNAFYYLQTYENCQKLNTNSRAKNINGIFTQKNMLPIAIYSP